MQKINKPNAAPLRAAPDFAHLTLDTGDLAIQKAFTLHPAVLAALLPIKGDSVARQIPLPTGTYAVKATGDRVSGCFSVWKDARTPLVLCLYCTDENLSRDLFAQAVATYRRVLDEGGCAFVGYPVSLTQPSAPWLSVQLLPGLAFDFEAALWLGDLERCLFYRLTQFDH